MAIREIPKTFEHQCDGCGWTEITDAPSRVRFWETLVIHRDGEWSDSGTKRLYCPKCCDAVEKLIHNFRGSP